MRTNHGSSNFAFAPTGTDRRPCSVTLALPIAQSGFLRTSQHYPKELMRRVRVEPRHAFSLVMLSVERCGVDHSTGSVTRCYATLGQTPEPNGVSPPAARAVSEIADGETIAPVMAIGQPPRTMTSLRLWPVTASA
jgi:hypothetical protein